MGSIHNRKVIIQSMHIAALSEHKMISVTSRLLSQGCVTSPQSCTVPLGAAECVSENPYVPNCMRADKSGFPDLHLIRLNHSLESLTKKNCRKLSLKSQRKALPTAWHSAVMPEARQAVCPHITSSTGLCCPSNPPSASGAARSGRCICCWSLAGKQKHSCETPWHCPELCTCGFWESPAKGWCPQDTNPSLPWPCSSHTLHLLQQQLF